MWLYFIYFSGIIKSQANNNTSYRVVLVKLACNIN
nr:MAG TPA: hypothetical protein [Caudoviricetes sp.]